MFTERPLQCHTLRSTVQPWFTCHTAPPSLGEASTDIKGWFPSRTTDARNFSFFTSISTSSASPASALLVGIKTATNHSFLRRNFHETAKFPRKLCCPIRIRHKKKLQGPKFHPSQKNDITTVMASTIVKPKLVVFAHSTFSILQAHTWFQLIITRKTKDYGHLFSLSLDLCLLSPSLLAADGGSASSVSNTLNRFHRTIASAQRGVSVTRDSSRPSAASAGLRSSGAAAGAAASEASLESAGIDAEFRGVLSVAGFAGNTISRLLACARRENRPFSPSAQKKGSFCVGIFNGKNGGEDGRGQRRALGRHGMLYRFYRIVVD